MSRCEGSECFSCFETLWAVVYLETGGGAFTIATGGGDGGSCDGSGIVDDVVGGVVAVAVAVAVAVVVIVVAVVSVALTVPVAVVVVSVAVAVAVAVSMGVGVGGSSCGNDNSAMEA